MNGFGLCHGRSARCRRKPTQLLRSARPGLTGTRPSARAHNLCALPEPACCGRSRFCALSFRFTVAAKGKAEERASVAEVRVKTEVRVKAAERGLAPGARSRSSSSSGRRTCLLRPFSLLRAELQVYSRGQGQGGGAPERRRGAGQGGGARARGRALARRAAAARGAARQGAPRRHVVAAAG